mmetsp:Transcript_1797/g.2717  ORF Transcript_1797/g.2717 Transcript_1797/m.2717 type:complete len:273 (+) Transcript_1797:2729-3547(+)
MPRRLVFLLVHPRKRTLRWNQNLGFLLVHLHKPMLLQNPSLDFPLVPPQKQILLLNPTLDFHLVLPRMKLLLLNPNLQYLLVGHPRLPLLLVVMNHLPLVHQVVRKSLRLSNRSRLVPVVAIPTTVVIIALGLALVLQLVAQHLGEKSLQRKNASSEVRVAIKLSPAQLLGRAHLQKMSQNRLHLGPTPRRSRLLLGQIRNLVRPHNLGHPLKMPHSLAPKPPRMILHLSLVPSRRRTKLRKQVGLALEVSRQCRTVVVSPLVRPRLETHPV